MKEKADIINLRDHLAIEVLQRLIISSHGCYPNIIALEAYKYADAMLEARKK